MFGERAPLLQIEEGASGGGSRATSGDMPTLTRKGAKASRGNLAAGKTGSVATEAEEVEVDDRPEFAGGGKRGGAQGRRKPSPDLQLSKPKQEAAPKLPWRATATLEGGVSPDVAYAQGALEKRINDKQVLQHLVDMRASGASEAQMLQWAQANEQDAESAQMMAREHFPRMREKVRQLQKDVDDARSLKIDPFHWHKSIGRGGRVAAAFAAMTGGLAAGKNNPNSAVKMMETAIEQDISAQEQNMKNTFEALKTQKGLLKDERELFDEHLGAMGKIRAVKYAGVVARIDAAMQHAVTEAHHLSLQTAKDHFQLKLINSIAAAQKEVIRLELDGGLNSLAKIQAYKKQIAQFGQELQVGPHGGISIPTEQVSTLGGDTVGQRPEAEIKMAQAPGRSARVADRGPQGPTGTSRGQGGPQKPSSSDSRDDERAIRSAALSRQPQIVEDLASSESSAEGATSRQRLETESEVETRVRAAEKSQRTEQANVTRAKARQEVSPRNITNFAANSAEIDAHPDAVKHESHARAFAKETGGVKVQLTSWPQAMEAIEEGRAIPNGGMTGNVDELVIAQALKHGYEPMPHMYKGGESSLLYQNAKLQFEYAQSYPATLGRNTVDEDGKVSKVQSGAGRNARVYTIMRGSRDPKNVAKIKEEINKFHGAVSGLERAARNVREIGLSGFFVKTEDGSMDWKIPGFTSDDPRVMQTTRDAITQAMQYIKTHDPTARISDQDLKVGLEAAANYTGGWDKFLDNAQSVFGNDTKRRQITNYLARVAIEAQRIMFEKMSNDIIPDYNTMQSLEDQHKANDRFMRSQHSDKK